MHPGESRPRHCRVPCHVPDSTRSRARRGPGQGAPDPIRGPRLTEEIQVSNPNTARKDSEQTLVSEALPLSEKKPVYLSRRPKAKISGGRQSLPDGNSHRQRLGDGPGPGPGGGPCPTLTAGLIVRSGPAGGCPGGRRTLSRTRTAPAAGLGLLMLVDRFGL